MKNRICVCEKCGSSDFYFSLSERKNTIFVVEDEKIVNKDTTYADDGEINYIICSKCGSEIQGYDYEKFISLVRDCC